ncbi:MAG: FtsX-like permease family protein [Steroidobacteraceae bacterium]|nr:FtsX-like permease family protein [Steroidobacteraceae bacterium]MBP9128969.1 FtsX-like permease family protein [Steroidobacteraceae bacterium]
MPSLTFALRNLLRDLKSGELAVLVLALLVAVASLTAVGFFTSRIGLAVERQAGEVLAADLRLESARPIADAYAAEAARRGLRSARLESMPSVVFFGQESSLIALRAVGAGYPLRGRLKTADQPFGAGVVTDDIPAPGEAWADSRLLAKLGAQVGASLTVGAHTVRVTRVLDYRPDQGSGFADLAATLLINRADLPATQLVQPGSRVSRAVLFAGEPAPVDDFREWLEAGKQRGERVRSIADASPQIRASADRAGRFLSLTSLVSVLLSAIAVAMAAQRYARRHLDTVALMKCMGAPQRFVLTQTVVQLVAIAVVTAVAGTAIGYVAQSGIAWLLRDLLRGDLPPPSADAFLLGVVTAVVVLVGFALPPLLRLKRVPPARVLRRDLEPPPLRYTVVYGLAIGAVLALLYWIVRDPQLVGYVAGGLGATFLLLAVAGWVLVRLLAPLRSGVGVAWRYGLANIARRGRDSIVQIVAFGLGFMVLLLLALVRDDLLRDWQRSLPTDAPNYFMINIRPDEGAGVEQFLAQAGLPATELVPMLRARLSAVNGTPVEKITFQGERANEFVEREANLTWSAELSPGNRIVAGEWWPPARDGAPQISVEVDYAERLGLKLGDTLTYDIAGEAVTGRITSLREVRWDTFKPNFFVVFSPGVLESATGTLITSVFVEPQQRPLLVDLVRQFPEVTLIDIEALLGQVRDVMNKASLAVQYVFLFTLAAGLMVLLAAVQSTRDERRYESAMLRTLGASRSVVFQGVAAEFIVLGALAGLLAAAGATAVGYLLAKQVFDLQYSPDPRVWLVGIVGGAVLVGTAGILAARSVVSHPPMQALRADF